MLTMLLSGLVVFMTPLTMTNDQLKEMVGILKEGIV